MADTGVDTPKRKDISKEAERFLEDLRHFMRDYEQLNVLMDEKEIPRETLLLATRMTVSAFNALPPLTGSYNLAQMLNLNLLEPMLYHASSNILMMRAQQQERNELSYSDGERSEVINNKAPAYKNTFNMLRSISSQAFKDFKIARNFESGYGANSGVYSDYAYIDDYL